MAFARVESTPRKTGRASEGPKASSGKRSLAACHGPAAGLDPEQKRTSGMESSR